MGIPELILAIVGLVGKAIPPLKRWLERRNGEYAVWKSELTHWAGRPRSISGRFLGREAELKKITNSFERLNVVVLSGGPGIGKSQLAAEYAKKSTRKGFWTPGGETPAQTLISLAPHLGIERGERSDDELLVQTRRRLQALPAKTLWVIDNLSDLDLLNTLLNETEKISILVTSKDGRAVIPEGVEYIPIGVLGPEPAVRLLCRSGHHNLEDSVFFEIVEEVGRLPRAVEALAVQLDSPGETPGRLLEELRAAPDRLELEIFRKQTPGLQIPQTDSLFNALRGPVDALTDDIKEPLAPLGYTADAPIPILLAKALTGLTGGGLINFLKECSSKSVLSADRDQIALHSLTTAVIAATNPNGSLQTALARAASRLGAISESRNFVPAEEMNHYEHMLSWASPLLDQEDEVIRAFSNNLANAYDSAGRFEEAATIHQENLEVRQRVLGPEHPDTLTSRNNLASAYDSAGRFEEAATIHQENLEVRQRVLGPNHPNTLNSRNNLAEAYRALGRDADANALFKQD